MADFDAPEEELSSLAKQSLVPPDFIENHRVTSASEMEQGHGKLPGNRTLLTGQ